MNKELFSNITVHQDLVKTLYLHHKSKDPKFSLNYICQRAGIPSKGYLADVMSAKRRLNRKYATKLGRVLGLTGLYLKAFQTTVERDHELNPQRKELLNCELKSLQKRLGIRRLSVGRAMDLRRLSKIFCLCGLCDDVTIEKIRGYLPEMTEEDVRNALTQLVEIGTLSHDGTEYKLVDSQVLIPSANQPQVLLEYLKRSLQEAAQALPKWFPNQSQSYIESTVVTVNMKAYLARLPEIKEFFDRIQSDLEGENADSLVYFNIQIYPQA